MQAAVNRVPGIDIEIQIAFRKEHLDLITPQLDKVGIPSSVIADMIDAYIASGEIVLYERWILEYGQRVINPMLNEKLKRSKDHPTFNNLLKFALKEQLENDPTLLELRKFKSKSGQKPDEDKN